MDITGRLGTVQGSKGLLSVAFPLDYVSKQHFYVNYVVSPAGCSVACGGILVVARYYVTANPDIAEKIRSGKVQAAGKIVGDVMKATRGQADAARVRELVLEACA